MPDDAPFYLGLNHTKTEKNIGHLKPSKRRKTVKTVSGFDTYNPSYKASKKFDLTPRNHFFP